ncbi:hypothetical protein LIER_13599 [Lithospermum erythrorhizon]|uniref:Uncharacterized protein n=1 Tax=Lithospermum erythrorhizon TaxID=34254 RepID=A0AAV3PY87_LITER
MNLEMLAKQGYFLCSSFIHAKLGVNPSFGWCSLLEGCRVLLKGLCWQVGDGRSIDIWMEPWVPRTTDFLLRGERGGEADRLRRNWIKEELDKCIEGEDRGLILSIPLSLRGGRDKLIWKHSHSGRYITCSGYNGARDIRKSGELRGGGRGECSNRGGQQGPLRELWKLKVAPRVKFFMCKSL